MRLLFTKTKLFLLEKALLFFFNNQLFVICYYIKYRAETSSGHILVFQLKPLSIKGRIDE